GGTRRSSAATTPYDLHADPPGDLRPAQRRGPRPRRRDRLRAPRDVRGLPRAPVVPDLTPAILTAIGGEDTSAAEPDTNLALRWILVAIAVAQIAVAI